MSISTLSFNSASRASLSRLQGSIAETTQELSSGRHADVGRTLGRLTGSAVSARAEGSTFKEQRSSNGLVATRLDNIDAALASVSEGAESLANTLIGSGVTTDFSTIIIQAGSGLQQLAGALNASSGGQYLFSGDNSDNAPLPETNVAATKQAAAADFLDFVQAATGGILPSAVSAADITAYLTTGYPDATTPTYRFSDFFNDPAWSTASDGTIESRISRTETITSSASANDQAFRDIAAAYTALTELGLESLNGDARRAVTDIASTQIKSASERITGLRADVGIKLQRIEASNAELLRQQDIAEKTVSALEDVDITEASLRVNALKTQLEAAYAVTGRIQGLSILNYI